MIREKDLVELTIKKMCNDINKGVIRRVNSPQIAAQKCNAIDAWEKMEHFMRFAKEMNELELRRRYAMLKLSNDLYVFSILSSYFSAFSFLV